MNDEKIKQGSFVEHLTELRSRLVNSFTLAGVKPTRDSCSLISVGTPISISEF